MTESIELRPESAADAKEINQIVLSAFGPGAFTRAAFRIREGTPHDRELSFVVTSREAIVGSVRLTPINVGSTSNGLLLGPLVVHPDHTNLGYGRMLVRHSLVKAEEGGSDFVLLVGDMPYYGPLGFSPIDGSKVVMPGPVDPDRLLVSIMKDGLAGDLSGLVRGRSQAD